MSSTTVTTGTTAQAPISNTTAGILFFLGLVFLGVGVWMVPSGAPSIVSEAFLLLGPPLIFVKYELQSLAPPKVSQTQQAAIAAVVGILAIIGGQISAHYPGVWYAGLIVVIIAAIVGAAKDVQN